MKLGLAARLGFIFAVLVAATVLVTSGASTVSTSSQVRNDVDRFLRDRAQQFIEEPRDDDRDDKRGDRRGRPDEAAPSTVATSIPSLFDPDSEVQLLDQDGVVVRQVGVALPIDDADLRLAAEPGGSLLRTESIDGENYRMITQHLPDQGAVQIARSIDDTNNLVSAIRLRTLLIGLIMSAVAGGIGWLVARRTTAPLRKLTRSVEEVAATRDLSTTVDLDRNDLERDDEIGRLAGGFNRMLQALARSRDQQHRLVQDAAHELRTPLTSINANVELLARAPDLDPDTRVATLEGIKSELRHLNGLFTEIIELATDARDTPSHRSIDLVDVVRAAVAHFESRTDRPVVLTGSSSPVVGDPAALERAVANLLSNAHKYNRPRAPITVQVGGGTVTVRDQGPGIPEAEIHHVFDRFYRSEEARSQPGSGLGLAIVDKIVTDHAGQAFIHNAEGGGIAAGFTLPQAPSGQPMEGSAGTH